jgi:hypothetical protein
VISYRFCSTARLWAATCLVTGLLLAADALLLRVPAHVTDARVAEAFSHLSWPIVLEDRFRRLHHGALLVFAPLVAAVLDGFLGSAPQRFPRGGQAVALASTTASIALLAPVSYGPGIAFLILVVLAALLRRLDGRVL